MQTNIGKKMVAIALIGVLVASFLAPAPYALASRRDERSVAADTISAVVEGLGKLRTFLASQGTSAEALAAIDQAIQGLQEALKVLAQTGDVDAARSGLKASSKQSERAAASSKDDGEEKKQNSKRLREAIKRSLERAEEIGKEVQKVEDESLRQRLQEELNRAVSLLHQASEALDRDDMKVATESFHQAVKILGQVVAELNRNKHNEAEKRHKDLAERIREHIEEIKKRLAKLAEAISESPVPQELKTELLAMLEEASRLVQAAEEALAKEDFAAVKEHLGRAITTVEEVQAKFRAAMGEHSVQERARKIIEMAEEFRQKVNESDLPDEVKAKINELIDLAVASAKEALAAAEKGKFEQARSKLADAEAALKKAHHLLREHHGKKDKRERLIEARIHGNALQIEFRNESDSAFTVVGVKVFTKEGEEAKEVTIDWKQGCSGTVEKGDKMKCVGIADFQKGQAYRLVITVQKGDQTHEITMRVTA